MRLGSTRSVFVHAGARETTSHLEATMKRFFLLALLSAPVIVGQVMDDPIVLKVDVENRVLYRNNVSDVSKLGKEPGPVAATENIPFVSGLNIGDIVAINGEPVKGIWSYSYIHTTPFRKAPQAGQFIADADQSAIVFCTWQIYAEDGTFLGVISDSGAGQGHSITGTLAAFFGLSGAHSEMGMTTPARVATTAEDPAKRRIHGGGKGSTTFHLYPRVRPAVHSTPNGPAVFHSDFSQVTAENPARPGEALIITATGLGPVKPNLDPPGAVKFSDLPYQEVNGPVTVIFNGKQLHVSNKIGWPGQTTLYRLDFQVPSDATAGMATIQLIATWIPGPAVTIPVGTQR